MGFCIQKTKPKKTMIEKRSNKRSYQLGQLIERNDRFG